MPITSHIINATTTDSPVSMSTHESGNNKLDRVLRVGVILDSIQYLNAYTVRDDDNTGGVFAACAGSTSGGQGLIGVNAHATYPVGTRVVCFTPHGLNYAIILCAFPRETAAKSESTSDAVLRRSGVGFYDDQSLYETLELPNRIRDFSLDNPNDAYPGEVGWHSPLGVMFHMSHNMAMLRATELAGMWLFHRDHTLRMAAYNWQFWGACKEQFACNDEGENLEVTRWSPYPWEMLGVASPETNFTKEPHGSVEYTAKNGDPLRKAGVDDDQYEPLENDQLLIPRVTSIRGYLAGLERETICIPPSGLDTETLTNESHYTGVAEFMKHTNGMLELRSAKGILLEKAVHIPVLKQMKRVDDVTGDTASEQGDSDYKFAGYYGDGPEHDQVEFEPPTPEARIAYMNDEMAWLHQNMGLKAAHRHAKDWLVSEEAETDLHNGSSIDAGMFSGGPKEQRAPLPASVTLPVDHRGDAKYYKGRAMVQLLDNGSVLIEDAWGSQIVMSEGNIDITCSGDINMRPGRNLNVLAPNDINLRAGHAADLTAGTSDVRIKADRNLHMLSGNSGVGGTLVESRGVGFSQDFAQKYGTDVVSNGILMLARESQVAAYGNGIYMRSLNGGDVILDSDTGQGSVQIYANTLQKLIQSHEVTLFTTTPDTGGAPDGWIYHAPGLSIFSNNNLILDSGSVVMPRSSSALVVNGKIIAQAAATKDGGELLKYLDWEFDGNINRIEELLAKVENKGAVNAAAIAPQETGSRPYYDEKSIGHADFLEAVGFSCRTDDNDNNQYGLTGFMLFDSRWQQMYAANSVGVVWEETVVPAPDGRDTLPFPGNTTWNKAGSMELAKLTYWTQEDGEAYGLDPYEADVKETTKTSLADGYLVKLQGT